MPSEYSDVSTSSCRTSDDGADILDDNKNNNNTAHAKINTHEIDEPVTVSIVVSSPATPTQGAPDGSQEVRMIKYSDSQKSLIFLAFSV